MRRDRQNPRSGNTMESGDVARLPQTSHRTPTSPTSRGSYQHLGLVSCADDVLSEAPAKNMAHHKKYDAE